MALFIVIEGVDRAASVRLSSGFGTASAAELGTVSMCTIEVDDPNGTLDIVPLKACYIIETLASPQRIWTGFMWEPVIDRGPYRTGAGRVWRCTAVDVNWNLNRRIIRSTDGQRPAETDLARMTWLMGHASMSGLVSDTGLVNLTDNPINLGAASYIGQYPADVLTDITPVAGKTAWAFYDESAGAIGLYYDLKTATVRTSTAKISNVAADINQTSVFYPLRDATLARSPDDMYAGIFLDYLKGRRYISLPSTASTYGERDFAVSTERIGALATANAYQQAFLTNHAAPVDTIEVTIETPAAHVNDILEGSRFQNKYTHLPGYSSYAYNRAIRRNVTQREGDSSTYQVKLTLSNGIRQSLGWGNPGSFPHQPPSCTWTLVQSATPGHVPAFGSLPTAGNLLVIASAERDTGVVTYSTFSQAESTVTTGNDSGSNRLFYKTSDGTEQNLALYESYANLKRYVWYEEWTNNGGLGVHSSHNQASAATIITTAVTVGASSLAFVMFQQAQGSMSIALNGGFGLTTVGQSDIEAGDSGPHTVFGYNASTTAGSYAPTATPSSTGFARPQAALVVEFVCDVAGSAPNPGQWVYRELVFTGDGTTVSGTTDNLFADGSLIVYVDILDQTAGLTAQDGSAGTFTLGFIPKLGEQVFATYQGR